MYLHCTCTLCNVQHICPQINTMQNYFLHMYDTYPSYPKLKNIFHLNYSFLLGIYCLVGEAKGQIIKSELRKHILSYFGITHSPNANLFKVN